MAARQIVYVKVAVMAMSFFPGERIQMKRSTPAGSLPAVTKLFQFFQTKTALKVFNSLKISLLYQ